MTKLDTRPGDQINRTIGRALGVADSNGETVEFDFNGVTVRVDRHSHPDLVARDWERAMDGCTDKTIGPVYRINLTPEEMQRDKVVREERKRKADAQSAAWRDKSQSAREALADRLSTAAPIQLKDAAGWDKARAANTDPYGGRVLTYAEDWARLMQLEIAAGKTVAECAERTSRQADHDGITGFMYGAAVSTLAQAWKHGDELREWHSRQYGVPGEEKGTANPSVLRVG